MRRILNDRTPRRVYIYDAGDGVVKVGCSLHPKKRRYPLKVAYGRTHMVLRFMSALHPRGFDIEATAHQMLKEYRLGAEELFQCSVEQAKAAILAAFEDIAEEEARLERHRAFVAERARLNPPQHDEHVRVVMEARREARQAREREAARQAEMKAAQAAAMATAHLQAAVEEACRVRPYMLAAEALIAENPTAAREAIRIWRAIEVMWRKQEAA